MKNVRMVFVGVCVALFITSIIQADESKESTASKALSDADKAKLKNDVKALAEAFGIESKTATTPTQTNQSAKEKSMADVTDKALDMVSNLVASASATLQNVAPEVWRIMIRQQYAAAFAYLVEPWGILFVIFMFQKILTNRWKDPDRDCDEEAARWFVTSFFPTIFGFICGIWGIYNIAVAAQMLINPEYYALRDLIKMLLSQTH